MRTTRSPHATPVLRCGQCGGPLERFDGDAYCPDCSTYTVTIHRLDDPTMPDVVDLGRDDDLIDLALARDA
jgi:hypothetical protein